MREKKDINIEIGGNIQVAREQAGYTQDTLSEMLGMTPNHLSAIERGASGISLEALQRLCRLLGVSADRIIFGTDEPETEALALARRISDIKPEYRQQVQELLSAILNMSKKRASADTQNGHRQRLLIRFPGIQTSAEIDTYFRAKEETAQGIQSLRLVNLRRSEACNHRLFRPLTVYTSMPCGRSADRR